MIAHKFLSLGALGLFSGFRWPRPKNGQPGAWVEIVGPLIPGSNGVHACLESELVNWIDDELWSIELAGEILEHEGVLVARRGRLLHLLEHWHTGSAAAFASDCVHSARAHAVETLRRDGRDEEAEVLEDLDDFDELQAAAAAGASRLAGFTSNAVAFVADAVELARGGRPEHYGAHPGASVAPTPGAIAANLGFVAAHAAGCAAADAADDPAAYDPGYEAERSRQRAWLAEKLRLAAPADSWRR